MVERYNPTLRAHYLASEISHSWKSEHLRNSPLIVLIGGFQGAGKSTLAGGLSESLGLTVISGDRMRSMLHADGFYSRSEEDKIVDMTTPLLLQKACTLGLSFVLDRNARPEVIEQVKSIVKESGRSDYQIFSVFLKTEPDILSNRLQRRLSQPGAYNGILGELYRDLTKYGWLNEDGNITSLLRVYDLVVTTDVMSPEEIKNSVLSMIKVSLV